jgi:hypothetical protein
VLQGPEDAVVNTFGPADLTSATVTEQSSMMNARCTMSRSIRADARLPDGSPLQRRLAETDGAGLCGCIKRAACIFKTHYQRRNLALDSEGKSLRRANGKLGIVEFRTWYLCVTDSRNEHWCDDYIRR